MARYYDTMIWTLRDYENLFEQILKGNSIARKKLIRKIISQEKNLKQIARTPKSTAKKLIEILNFQSYGPNFLNQLHDFFSSVDLE